MNKSLKFLGRIIRPYKYSALFLFLLMVITALTETLGLGLILPLLEIIAGNNAGTHGSLRWLSPFLQYFAENNRLLVVCILLVILFLLKNLLIICRIGFSAYFTKRFQKFWQSAIMKKYMHAKYPFFLANKQGRLLNNLVVEPSRAAKSLQRLIDFFSRLILASFLYGLLFLVNWKITLGITTTSVIIIFLMRKITGSYALNVGKKRLAYSQQLSAQGAENISAIRQIKTFSLEDEVSGKFTQKLEKNLPILIKFNIITVLFAPVIESLLVVIIACVLIYVNYLAKLSFSKIIPILGLFIIISQRLFPMVSFLFTERMFILSLIPSLKLVNELYTAGIDQEELHGGIIVNQIKEDIRIENIYFSYTASKPLFQGLNMVIPHSKTTAIVGPSGSGKTTIMDLLMRFFEKKSGAILINGFDLAEINLQSWRKLSGYISQDTFLFNATVKENILAGKPGASPEEIITAAKKANAHQFIIDFPSGYDTLLGDRGLKISGGQRQRIAIARALIRDPQLLIFDEATSSLDYESERLIHQSIQELSGEKTIIVISHRFSTIEGAQLIYVLNNGQIVDSGTFAEINQKI